VNWDSIDLGKDLHEQIDINWEDFWYFVIELHYELGIETPDVDLPELATLNRCAGYRVSKVGKL
jgi:hypothetical protein